MEPERSVSEEKNTVWKVVGERKILEMTEYPHNASKDIPYHGQRLLKLLKVNGSTFVEIKVIKRILPVKCGKHTYLPFPYLIQQRLKLFKINLPAMD